MICIISFIFNILKGKYFRNGEELCKWPRVRDRGGNMKDRDAGAVKGKTGAYYGNETFQQMAVM